MSVGEVGFLDGGVGLTGPFFKLGEETGGGIGFEGGVLFEELESRFDLCEETVVDENVDGLMPLLSVDKLLYLTQLFGRTFQHPKLLFTCLVLRILMKTFLD